ncbi:MAG: hypothetical protein JKX68_10105 [Flavobacteriales bacterium]|nr:hypothetical protein [Flavobacteriales bacterium]
MLVSEFSETCQLYTGFQIWEIENINAFFEGNQVLATIFKDHYGLSVDELEEKRNEIEENDLQIMTTLLRLIDDKSFFIFTLHDENHLELVKMQQLKVMDFGIDIEDVKGDRVYVVIMDKKK